MKKKKYLIGILGLLSLWGLYQGYTHWQYQSMGYREPTLESRDSILEFAEAKQLPGTVVIPKDSQAYAFVYRYFDAGMIYVFDPKGKVLDTNIRSLGGTCYADVVEAICNDYSFPIRKARQVTRIALLDSLLKVTTPLSVPISENLTHYEYIIVYGWVRYIGASYTPDLMQFGNCALSETENQSLIISVNSDFVDSWFSGKVPSLGQDIR